MINCLSTQAPTWLRKELEDALENPASDASHSWSPISEPPTTYKLDSSITEGEISFLSGQDDALKQSSASSSHTGGPMSSTSTHGPLSSADNLHYSAGTNIQQGLVFESSRTGAHSDQAPVRRLIGGLANVQQVYSSGLIPATIQEMESESRTGSRSSLNKATGPVKDTQTHPLAAAANIPHLIKGAISVEDLPQDVQANEVLNVKKTQSVTDISGAGQPRGGRTGHKSGAVISGRIRLKPIQSTTKGGRGGGGGGGGGGVKMASTASKGYSKAVSAGELENGRTGGYNDKRRASEISNKGEGGGGGAKK